MRSLTTDVLNLGQRAGTDGKVLPDRYWAAAVHFTHPRFLLTPVRSGTRDVCDEPSKLTRRTPAVFIHAHKRRAVQSDGRKYPCLKQKSPQKKKKKHSVTKNTEEKTQNLPGFGVNR